MYMDFKNSSCARFRKDVEAGDVSQTLLNGHLSPAGVWQNSESTRQPAGNARLPASRLTSNPTVSSVLVFAWPTFFIPCQ